MGIPSPPRTPARPRTPRRPRASNFHLAFVVFSCLVTFLMVMASQWSYCSLPPFPEHDRPVENVAKGYLPEQKQTLVVYAGPSNKEAGRKAGLYETNLNHFLQHGIDCALQDTVIVVGDNYFDDYRDRIEGMQKACSQKPHHGRIVLVPRRDVCYDMEAVRLVFYGGVHGIDVRTYEYFVYANCGVSGPPPRSDKPWWTTRFTDMLDDSVKMSGLTVNCEKNTAHVMSMVYALDKVGIDLIYKSGAVYDCLTVTEKDSINNVNDFINNYERKMGEVILKNNYTLQALLRAHPTQKISTQNLQSCFRCQDSNATEEGGVSCSDRAWTSDIWLEPRLKKVFGGTLPSLDDVVFYKSSRLLPPHVAQQINYTGNVTWTWK